MRVARDGGLVGLREMEARRVEERLLLSSRGLGGFVGVPGGLGREARGREAVLRLVVEIQSWEVWGLISFSIESAR
jgi:hypothetical protein